MVNLSNALVNTSFKLPSARLMMVVWVAFVAIAILYFFGLVASAVISFGPPRSFASVAHEVSMADFLSHDFSMAFHGAVLGTAVAALLSFTFSRSRRLRLGLPLVCFVAPLFFTPGDGMKGFARWLLAIPLAPIFTVTSLAGWQDGEFYAEGFLVYTAIGWWMFLWCVLFFRELRLSKNEVPTVIATTASAQIRQ